MDFSMAMVLIAIAFGVGYAIGRMGQGAQALPPLAPPDPAALEAVRPILRAEGKIAAIKAYRQRTGTGLRDAKWAVDTLDSDTM